MSTDTTDQLMDAPGDSSTPNLDEQSSPPPPLPPSGPSRPLRAATKTQSDWQQRDAAAKESMFSDELSQFWFDTRHSHHVGSHIHELARKRATEADLKKGKKCLITDLKTVVQLCHVVDRAAELNIVSVCVFLQGAVTKPTATPFLPSFAIYATHGVFAIHSTSIHDTISFSVRQAFAAPNNCFML